MARPQTPRRSRHATSCDSHRLVSPNLSHTRKLVAKVHVRTEVRNLELRLRGAFRDALLSQRLVRTRRDALDDRRAKSLRVTLCRVLDVQPAQGLVHSSAESTQLISARRRRHFNEQGI